MMNAKREGEKIKGDIMIEPLLSLFPFFLKFSVPDSGLLESWYRETIISYKKSNI